MIKGLISTTRTLKQPPEKLGYCGIGTIRLMEQIRRNPIITELFGIVRPLMRGLAPAWKPSQRMVLRSLEWRQEMRGQTLKTKGLPLKRTLLWLRQISTYLIGL